MDADSPRVHVVDDDEALRDALGVLLRMAGFAVCTFPDAESVLAEVTPATAGCLVVDVRMPGMGGLELQQELTRRGVTMPLIVITGHGDVPMAVQALKAGALDFFEKPFDDRLLIERVREALAADARARAERREHDAAAERIGQLSPREREVMRMVAEGLSNKVIGARLGISSRTVETHRARVMEKTGATSAADLTRLVLRLSDDDP